MFNQADTYSYQQIQEVTQIPDGVRAHASCSVILEGSFLNGVYCHRAGVAKAPAIARTPRGPGFEEGAEYQGDRAVTHVHLQHRVHQVCTGCYLAVIAYHPRCFAVILAAC